MNANPFATPTRATVSPLHRRLVVPWIPQLEQLVPNAVKFDWGGKPHLALHHDAEHVRLVRNFGILAPAPIMTHYDWSGCGTRFGLPVPFESQKQTAAMLTVEKRAYVLNGMGTGKTRSAIFAFDWLRKEKQIRSTLIVAPLSTLTTTWAREIFVIAPHLKVRVLHGSRAKRYSLLAEPADVYIINHDGIATVIDELIARDDIDLVVLDELAAYRNGQSKRFKDMRRLLAVKDRAWGMTGSPTPNGPTDAWAQAKLMTPWTVPMGFVSFRDSVMVKVSQFKWVPKASALSKVHEILQPAVRFTLDDVMELPDTIYRNVEIEQGPKQKEVYTKLESHLRILFDKGQLTIANSGVLMNKLLQVSMGWVYTDDRGVVGLDNDARLDALTDIVDSTDRKVIIFVPYIHALDGVSAHLKKHSITHEVVSGKTSKTVRDDVFNRFQNAAMPKALVAHPECMSHGLTLTAADTIVWFGPFASPEIYEQANARIVRVGQKHKTQILMFNGTKVEQKLYTRLQQKAGVQSVLLDMFRDDTARNTP